MKLQRDEVRNTRAVRVEFDIHEVCAVLRDRVATNLVIPREVADEHLSVEIMHDRTAYVHGEIPLTREQLLESLGLTPTEPVETVGAALADDLASGPVTSDAALLAELRELQEANERAGSWGAAVGAREERIRAIQAALGRGATGPGPAVGDNPGTQLGTGAYTPEAEALPSRLDEAATQLDVVVRTLRRIPEAVATVRRYIDVEGRLSPNSVDVAVTKRVFEAAAALPDGTVPDVDRGVDPVYRRVTTEDVESLQAQLRALPQGSSAARLLTKVVEALSRAPEAEPLVPRRGPRPERVDMARERLKVVRDDAMSRGGLVRVSDLDYVLSLLGDLP